MIAACLTLTRSSQAMKSEHQSLLTMIFQSWYFSFYRCADCLLIFCFSKMLPMTARMGYKTDIAPLTCVKRIGTYIRRDRESKRAFLKTEMLQSIVRLVNIVLLFTAAKKIREVIVNKRIFRNLNKLPVRNVLCCKTHKQAFQ